MNTLVMLRWFIFSKTCMIYVYFQMMMGDNTPLPTAQNSANTANEVNGDLDDIDPFKPKMALANSPTTSRKTKVCVLQIHAYKTYLCLWSLRASCDWFYKFLLNLNTIC